jgi:hypothetical protein
MEEKYFVPYELALEMKALGFNENCLAYYNPDVDSTLQPIDTDFIHFRGLGESLIKSPIFSQAFRWFREKHDLQCWPEPTGSDRYTCRYNGIDETGKRWVGYLTDGTGVIMFYSKFEEAELDCLRKLIVIVKNKATWQTKLN